MAHEIGIVARYVAPIVIIASLVVARVARGGDAEWAFTGEQATPALLPLQAARIRITLRNVGAERSPEIYQLPGWTLHGIQRPNARQEQKLIASTVYPGRVADGWRLPGKLRRYPPLLAPGEAIVTSVSVAGDVVHDDAYFETPGTYSLRFAWRRTSPADEIDTHPLVSVVVGEPAGADAKALVDLQKTPRLVQEMLRPLGAPHKDVVPLLERFVAEHGATSYGDYARFALARSAATLIYEPTEEELDSGARLLEAIDHKSFAYGDYALAMLAYLEFARHRELKNERIVEIEARLTRLFPDSYVRLESLASRWTGTEWYAHYPLLFDPPRDPARK